MTTSPILNDPAHTHYVPVDPSYIDPSGYIHTPDISFHNRQGERVSVTELESRIQEIEKTLLILRENPRIFEESQTLRDAYEEYQTLRALTLNG